MPDIPERLDTERGSILAVGLHHADLTDAPNACTTADNARAAFELLRMLRFDLVVTADRLPDMPVWQFVRRLRTAWPWQKWALFSHCLSESDEITARTLGVMRIIEGSMQWDAVAHLAGSIHEQMGASQRQLATRGMNVLRPAASAG